jgi:hypothetical protein
MWAGGLRVMIGSPAREDHDDRDRDPLAQAVSALPIRSGGAEFDTKRLITALETGSCTAVRVLARQGPVPLEYVIGQRPAACVFLSGSRVSDRWADAGCSACPLFDLARAAQPVSPRQRHGKTSRVTDGIQQCLPATWFRPVAGAGSTADSSRIASQATRRCRVVTAGIAGAEQLTGAPRQVVGEQVFCRRRGASSWT